MKINLYEYFVNRRAARLRPAPAQCGLWCCERATAAIEFALATPMLMAFLAPVADLGMAFSDRVKVEQAAQAGAQYAMLHPWSSQSVAKISTAVTEASTLNGIAASPPPRQICGCPNGTGIATVTCSSSCPDGTVAGYYVVVSAQAPYKTTLPYSVLGNSPTLTAAAIVRIQ